MKTAREIIVGLSLLVMLIAPSVWMIHAIAAEPAPEPVVARPHFPRTCDHLRVEPIEKNWNHVTETYESDDYDQWFECMGVGRK